MGIKETRDLMDERDKVSARADEIDKAFCFKSVQGKVVASLTGTHSVMLVNCMIDHTDARALAKWITERLGDKEEF